MLNVQDSESPKSENEKKFKRRDGMLNVQDSESHESENDKKFKRRDGILHVEDSESPKSENDKKLRKQNNFRCVKAIERTLEADAAKHHPKKMAWRLLAGAEGESEDIDVCLHLKGSEVEKAAVEEAKNPGTLAKARNGISKQATRLFKWLGGGGKSHVTEFVDEMNKTAKEQCHRVTDPLERKDCEIKAAKKYRKKDLDNIISNQLGFSF